jgi:hypothetical protein
VRKSTTLIDFFIALIVNLISFRAHIGIRGKKLLPQAYHFALVYASITDLKDYTPSNE